MTQKTVLFDIDVLCGGIINGTVELFEKLLLLSFKRSVKSAAAVKNFLYRKKVTNGKTVVKICKLPVFVKRNGGGA